ncbi:Mono- and diacylglycerol lipase [Cytospora mali]|uniref:Mono-and diacylglycerol lipase n=1 Tax=Cytospora mali TaxID=578113 RepID=A0A194V8X2_CYTMA|nr:Mono- and diacylglycerol lipase [Valsa mali var. pyri (nom. inval.)]
MGWFSRNKTKKSSPGGPPPVPLNAKTAPLCPPRPYHGQPTPAQFHAPQASGITGPNISCPASQPAGYLPPPPGWHGGSPRPSYPYQQENPQQAPIVVNQHYYLLPGPQSDVTSQIPQANKAALSKLTTGSAVNLAIRISPGALPLPIDNGPLSWNGGVQQGATTKEDHMLERFNDVMTLIDRDRYTGDEKDLFVCPSNSSPTSSSSALTTTKGLTVAASVVSGSYFAKVELYANSRLPMNLPPLKLYIPTWPLLCLAAQYSDRVYEKSRGAEKDVHVSADYRSGTRATVIKSVPMDHMNTIVFAIRGTATFMDWAVNLNTEPTSPAGFLDDAGNYCHAGFLKSARKMIKPVATRLRQLLQEDPSRRSYSLLITGHSAGGAVAALLYAHMLSTSPSAASELNALTGCFRRVHCVTFGAPPVTLLPLQKPEGRPELNKSLFLSFVNEGDPVARADKAYVRSLLELFAKPAPTTATTTKPKMEKPPSSSSLLSLSTCPKQNRSSRTSSLSSTKSEKSSGKSSNTKRSSSRDSSSSSSSRAPKKASTTASTAETTPQSVPPVWKVPPSTLSNAGRIVVLRSGDPAARLKGKKTVEERLNEGVVAQVVTDEQLRGVVWGNPVCHVMKLYAGRLEILAIAAVTAKGY